MLRQVLRHGWGAGLWVGALFLLAGCGGEKDRLIQTAREQVRIEAGSYKVEFPGDEQVLDWDWERASAERGYVAPEERRPKKVVFGTYRYQAEAERWLSMTYYLGFNQQEGRWVPEAGGLTRSDLPLAEVVKGHPVQP